jgi:predicted MFS family arabinose efflux permease
VRSRPTVAIAVYYFWLFAALGVFWPYYGPYLASLGLLPAQITALFAAFPLMNVLGPPLCGLLADHWHARGLALRALSALCAASFAGFLLVGRSRVALCAVALGFALFRSPLGALADASALEAARAGGSYGQLRRFGSLGFLIAVLFGGAILDAAGLRAVFAVALAALAVMAATAFLTPAAAPHAEPRLFSAYRALLSRRDLWLFLCAMALADLAGAPYDSLFSLHLGRLGFSGRFTGLAWAVGVASEILLLSRSGVWMARFRAERVFALAIATASLRWLLSAHATAPWEILLLQPLHGVTFGLLYASAVTIMRARVASEAATAAQGLLAGLYSAGGAIGFSLAGTVYQHGGARLVFHVAAGCALAGTACALAFIRLQPRAAESVRTGVG